MRRFMSGCSFEESTPSRAQRTIALERVGRWVSIRDSASGDLEQLTQSVSLAMAAPALAVPSDAPLRLFVAGNAGAGIDAWTAGLAASDASVLARILSHALRDRPETHTGSMLRLIHAVGTSESLRAPRPTVRRELNYRLPAWAELRPASGLPLLSDGGYPGYTLRLQAGETWSFDTGTYVGNEGGSLRGLEVRVQMPPSLKRKLTVEAISVRDGAGRSWRFSAGPLRRVFPIGDLELGPGWGLPPDGHIEDWYTVFTRELRRQAVADQHRRRLVSVLLSGRAIASCEGALEVVFTPLANSDGAVVLPIHVAVR
ncbi:MAG: hypothetical protein R2729_14295 [Bryobacteraceae bacterium]